MAAIYRKTLLQLMQDRAAEAGVDMRFGRYVPDLSQLDGFDLIVGADGANSSTREQLGDGLGHTAETATAKFIWFGTSHKFKGMTFLHRKSEFGNFAVHGYPISEDLSTFIVETDEETWRKAGLDEFDVSQPPGPSDLKTQRFLEKLFAEEHCRRAAGGQQLPLGELPHPPDPVLAQGQRRPARRCRAHRAISPSDPARKWPWKTPSPSSGKSPRTRTTSRRPSPTMKPSVSRRSPRSRTRLGAA